jgi:hypothetical protein
MIVVTHHQGTYDPATSDEQNQKWMFVHFFLRIRVFLIPYFEHQENRHGSRHAKKQITDI